MSDVSPAGDGHRSFIERLSSMLLRTPDDRAQLIEVLRRAQSRHLLDAEALSMIEGVLQVSELAVRDIMVPRSQMAVINIRETPSQFLPRIVEAAHSRFPVVDGDRDRVVGILHAKDLLRLKIDDNIDIRDLLRPPVFVPESKRLNVLLRDFRSDRHHLAIVVDEYGGTAGLITIEDVLEQIVGDIEDEFDFDEASDHILSVEAGEHGARYRVRALTDIAQLNEAIGAALPMGEFDTIGGLVTDQMGRVPRRGESIDIEGVRFHILRADARQVHLLLVERVAAPDVSGPNAG
ncbi:MAG: HlyC/CorC family transporter [Betaproteobacteria bacterium]